MIRCSEMKRAFELCRKELLQSVGWKNRRKADPCPEAEDREVPRSPDANTRAMHRRLVQRQTGVPKMVIFPDGKYGHEIIRVPDNQVWVDGVRRN